jgi:hypothetical protein
MAASVYLIEAPPQAADEALGGLADVGTEARLDAPLEALAALCDSVATVRLTRTRAESGEPAARLRAELERQASREPVFAVVAESAGGPAAPRVVVAGPGLPSMGPSPPCDLACFEASLRYALGDRAAHEGSLFSEPGEDEPGDERLLTRLRQLYGE